MPNQLHIFSSWQAVSPASHAEASKDHTSGKSLNLQTVKPANIARKGRGAHQTCMSDVHSVRLSRKSCMMSVLSLYDSSPSVSSSAMASSKACKGAHAPFNTYAALAMTKARHIQQNSHPRSATGVGAQSTVVYEAGRYLLCQMAGAFR